MCQPTTPPPTAAATAPSQPTTPSWLQVYRADDRYYPSPSTTPSKLRQPGYASPGVRQPGYASPVVRKQGKGTAVENNSASVSGVLALRGCCSVLFWFGLDAASWPWISQRVAWFSLYGHSPVETHIRKDNSSEKHSQINRRTPLNINAYHNRLPLQVLQVLNTRLKPPQLLLIFLLEIVHQPKQRSQCSQ